MSTGGAAAVAETAPDKKEEHHLTRLSLVKWCNKHLIHIEQARVLKGGTIKGT